MHKLPTQEEHPAHGPVTLIGYNRTGAGSIDWGDNHVDISWCPGPESQEGERSFGEPEYSEGKDHYSRLGFGVITFSAPYFYLSDNFAHPSILSSLGHSSVSRYHDHHGLKRLPISGRFIVPQTSLDALQPLRSFTQRASKALDCINMASATPNGSVSNGQADVYDHEKVAHFIGESSIDTVIPVTRVCQWGSQCWPTGGMHRWEASLPYSPAPRFNPCLTVSLRAHVNQVPTHSLSHHLAESPTLSRRKAVIL